ncbi:iron-containing alcohol dehydrogenase family protein [Pectinatus brassicae]|uniref:Glycerol dehydrogenase n=1 Tax=Pectinatus brassicae TaxID=862415 RepID=A0A840UU47_9FIRM|nr:iron-containing alcohol dehydrogenase family protein [Pectinatus brassicae]MBB5336473.1 glycerol dehydrogenase [Pectinatus brassicae]
MRENYSVYLPQYSVGPNCYDEIGAVTKYFGKKIVIIGGMTALQKAEPAIVKAIAKAGLEHMATIWYGGNSSESNVQKMIDNKDVQAADIIFGVGGGRAIDTAKAAADTLEKPYFSFPTVASNCAPSSAISVLYNDDGSLSRYYFPKQCPLHIFINTAIIADSPVELLWAGIGDALSKECEVDLAVREKGISHTPLIGYKAATACTTPLLEYGEKALAAIDKKQPSYELAQVVLDIIISTGIASNMTCSAVDNKIEYYYNSSLAHCFYNSYMELPQGHDYRHGAVVAYGVLVLLTYDGQLELRNKIAAFNKKMKLPVTLSEVGISKDSEIDMIINKAPEINEWNCVPYKMDQQKYKQAILAVDEYGKTLQ